MARDAVVEVPDTRSIDARLRLSWHADQRKFVVSQWKGPVCVASTPVDISEIPDLLCLMVNALEEAAATQPDPVNTTEPSLRSVSRDVMSLARKRIRPTLAPVLELTKRSNHRDQ